MAKKGLPKVALRGGFSDRMGINPINTEMQTKSLDDRTRVSIVNLLNAVFGAVYENDYFGREKNLMLSGLLNHVYLQQVSYSDDIRYDEKIVFENFINNTILNDEYDSVFTVLEYLVQQMDAYSKRVFSHMDVCNLFNSLFEREYVGYRFVDGILVPITGKEEIVEIKNAIKKPYENVNKHLEKALFLLANRDAPDYENSIKESISAVEALCSDILGTNGTLNDALKKIEKEKVVFIHPALKEAFIKLYGYVGDASSGIRHAAKLGGVASTFQEARYMLVASSAFINYLIANLSEPNKG